MKYKKDFRYMAIIETVKDVDNTFLSRRELTCNFAGLGGNLKKLDAMDMISKEFKLDGKVIIPVLMKNQVGRKTITGTFYVYDDENLAKKHVNPSIMARLEKAKAKKAESETAEKQAESEKPEESTEAESEESGDKKEEKS